MTAIDDIVREIGSGRRFLLTAHIHPDGDAIGSLLALGALLEALGKSPVLFTEDRIPSQYLFLPGVEKITHNLPAFSDIDACFVLDCGDVKRIGTAAAQILEINPVIVIDHHLTQQTFGDIRWIAPEVSAVGELIYHLIKVLGVNISYEIATNLYVAIFTDTGSFRYTGTSSQAMRIAAELIDLGVKPWQISEMIYENYTANRFRLLSVVLSTLRTYYGGRVGLISVSRDMLRATGTSIEDTEGFVNYPRSISGVQLAIFLKETGDDLFAVSLRSRDGINVARLAEKFGGGGHFKAAGFKRSGDYETVKQELLSEIGSFMEEKSLSTHGQQVRYSSNR